MYSGTTLTNYSGAFIGAHQKIDRTAYRLLKRQVQSIEGFPTIKAILHFEGKNGPDGIKRKSPAKDEPWHFYNPLSADDTELIRQIGNHYDELVRQLRRGYPERAAFDAAWLAHAVVDGLTPAHHFPYEEKLVELRGGADMSSRNSLKNKLIIPGETLSDSLKKNWAMWGVGGLMSMHGMFEMGVAFMMAPIRFPTASPTEGDLNLLVDIGSVEYFKRAARQIALLDMYTRFHKSGWTPKLARDVRNELGPTLIKTVCVVWYSAMRDAGLLKDRD